MKKALIALCSALILLGAVASAIAAPITWSVNGHDYEVIFANEISWQDARDGAIGLGSDWNLATITSAEEQAFIETLLGDASSGVRREFWLGGYQDPIASAPDENWHWVTNEAFTYVQWGEGQPDDWDDPDYPGEGDYPQYFLAMDSDQGDWDWDDNTSTLRVIDGYVVERHVSIPDASVLLLLGSACLVGFSVTRKRH